jgi:hypothetical protein
MSRLSSRILFIGLDDFSPDDASRDGGDAIGPGALSGSAFTRSTKAASAFIHVPKRLRYASPPTLDGERLISEKLGRRP